jgi:4'-phosphopantetheinyl transferase
VELWRIDVRRTLARHGSLDHLLDRSERDRASRFMRPADAVSYRTAHGALRAILAQHCGRSPGDLRFARGPHGKPALPGPGPHFSLSHSGPLAILAVCADHEVGADVEELRDVPEALAIARRLFGEREAQALARRQPKHRSLQFIRGWTALEAILKADGVGLAESEARAAARGEDRGWVVRWQLLAPRHLCAVAIAGHPFTVVLRSFA